MEPLKLKQKRKLRRRKRVRRKLVGTPKRPRLCVFRSGQHIYCQIIDDLSATTLASASTMSPELREEVGKSAGNVRGASLVGKAIAERAKAKGITQVAFDRNGNKYHGRVRSVCESARENGLKC